METSRQLTAILAALPTLLASGVGIVGGSVVVEGTLSPAGPPDAGSVRVEAGGGCVVDLAQQYTVTGGLSGKMKIDYRILVHGPCGSPAGTFDEEWIAHGGFEGTLASDSVTATFVYTAEVRNEGEIRGRMTFGDGLGGEVAVRGRFADGELSYSGAVKQEPGVRGR